MTKRIFSLVFIGLVWTLLLLGLGDNRRRLVLTGLHHQVVDVGLEVVNPGGHVVDSRDDLEQQVWLPGLDHVGVHRQDFQKTSRFEKLRLTFF